MIYWQVASRFNLARRRAINRERRRTLFPINYLPKWFANGTPIAVILESQVQHAVRIDPGHGPGPYSVSLLTVFEWSIVCVCSCASNLPAPLRVRLTSRTPVSPHQAFPLTRASPGSPMRPLGACPVRTHLSLTLLHCYPRVATLLRCTLHRPRHRQPSLSLSSTHLLLLSRP